MRLAQNFFGLLRVRVGARIYIKGVRGPAGVGRAAREAGEGEGEEHHFADVSKMVWPWRARERRRA